MASHQRVRFERILQLVRFFHFTLSPLLTPLPKTPSLGFSGRNVKTSAVCIEGENASQFGFLDEILIICGVNLQSQIQIAHLPGTLP